MTLWSAYGSSSQSRTFGGICEGKQEQEEEEERRRRRRRRRRQSGYICEDITDANVWITL
jgi:hypothetical protein